MVVARGRGGAGGEDGCGCGAACFGEGGCSLDAGLAVAGCVVLVGGKFIGQFTVDFSVNSV